MPLHFPFESRDSSFWRRTEEDKKKKTVAKQKKEPNKSHSFSLYPAEVYSQLIPRVLIFHNTKHNTNKHQQNRVEGGWRGWSRSVYDWLPPAYGLVPSATRVIVRLFACLSRTAVTIISLFLFS